jgi:hypothetical protein
MIACVKAKGRKAFRKATCAAELPLDRDPIVHGIELPTGPGAARATNSPLGGGKLASRLLTEVGP